MKREEKILTVPLAVLGALAGGLYVLLMPVIGAGAILWYGGIRLGRAVGDAAVHCAVLFADHAAPGTSPFAGRPRTTQKDWDQIR